MSPSIQLLIADDHPLIRSGMRSQIEPIGGESRFCVHEAGDAASLRAALARAQARGLPVELALVDVMMPGMQGADSVLELAQGFPQVAFLVVTGLPVAQLLPMLRSQPNIRGVLDKGHSAADLRRAIDLALAGVPVWPATDSRPMGWQDMPSLAPHSISSRADSMSATSFFSSQNSSSEPSQGLSPRQRDVALAVARGLTNAQIAAELGLTEGTVKAYLKDVFRILGASNRTQLALRMGGQGSF
jgi:DNA-binding NarL/FixJ family response regulator